MTLSLFVLETPDAVLPKADNCLDSHTTSLLSHIEDLQSSLRLSYFVTGTVEFVANLKGPPPIDPMEVRCVLLVLVFGFSLLAQSTIRSPLFGVFPTISLVHVGVRPLFLVPD